MELEDRYVTATPEGVPLSIVLAGLGSRAAAYLIDYAIQIAFVLVMFFALTRLAWSNTSAYVAVGVFAFVYFVTVIGYFVVFETFDGGRSIGKRAIGIQVTRADGAPVNFRSSLVRNLMRILYAISVFYVVDAILIAATGKHQRLGDLLAGTIVVRRRIGALPTMKQWSWDDPALWSRAASGYQAPHPPAQYPSQWPSGTGHPQGPPYLSPIWVGSGPPPELASWDVSAIDSNDMAVVHAFLARRHSYEPSARAALAQDIAARLAPRIAGIGVAVEPERLLESLAMIKAASSARR